MAGDKKSPHTVTEEILSDLDIPLDSALIEHAPADEDEDATQTELPGLPLPEEPSYQELNTSELNPNEDVVWAPVDEQVEQEGDVLPETASTESQEGDSLPLGDELPPLEAITIPEEPFQMSISESGLVKDPAQVAAIPQEPSLDHFREQLRIIMPTVNRRKFREIQEQIGSTPTSAYELKVTWAPSQSHHRKLFSTMAQYWLKPTYWARLMIPKGVMDSHPDLEKAIAYRLWRFLQLQGIESRVVKQKPPQRLGTASVSPKDELSYLSMTRTIYGANLPDIPTLEAAGKKAEDFKQCVPVEGRLALPNYFDESNTELVKSLAQRLIRLRAVEALGKCLSHFSYSIETEDGQRFLVCNAKVWL